jgi:two-component system CheB/CheR fusion protein
MTETAVNPAFETLLEYLQRSRGFDYSGYKRPGLMRRIEKRMEMVNIRAGDFPAYTDYLEVHPDEFTHLFNTILINVTSFFRDEQTWEYIAKDVIPRILEAKSGDESIRVWSAGCATGEEAYTIAMLLLEALGRKAFERRVKIFATDVDEEALAQARLASYTEQQVEAVPEPLRTKYFEQQNNKLVFHRDYRRAIIFGRHDLLQDAPISKIDLITCRNALMYFNSEAQGRVLERFHFALNDSGVLLMGKAEMLFSRMNLFVPLDLKRRSFVKVSRVPVRDRMMNGSQNGGDPLITPLDGLAHSSGDALIDHMRIREAAFNVDPIACIVLDPDQTLILANDRARALFRFSDRDIGRRLGDMEVSYRPVELRSRIEHAVTTRSMVESKDIAWPTAGEEARYFDIQIIPLFDAGGALLAVKVAFCDVTRTKKLQEEVQQSHMELETAYEELQSSNEERETANEELQSTNEELETTNEEIQSTNEELETMNEELQSTNEELSATNEELRQRSTELTETNAFLRAILSSMRSGVAVVDKELRVRAWNDRAEELWGLRASEVTGQFFFNLDIGLPVDQLKQRIRAAMSGGDGEEILLKATNRRGRDIVCRVGCMPVRDGHVDGANGGGGGGDGNGSNQGSAGVWGVIVSMDEEKPSA